MTPRAKRMLPRLIGGAVLIVTLCLVVLAFRRAEHYPHTDAAEVAAAVVSVSAIVPGQVVEVLVKDTEYVEKGDVLFRVDPEPYELELIQARAALSTAKSELAQGQRNLDLERSNAAVAAKQIDRARNNLTLAQATLDRLVPLLAQGYVTEQQVETARTAVSDAEVSMEQARAHAAGTDQFVGTLDTRKSQVTLAEASVALAERNLRNTERRAPVSGRVTGLKLDPGEYVVTGTSLFSVIDTAHWHVSALFRETDLPQINVGDRAQVFFLADPDVAIEGEVSGVGWGIRSSEEGHLFGMPIVANRIDWVRTARRFPVEITLHDPPEDLTRVGLSVSVRILDKAECDEAHHGDHAAGACASDE